MSTTRTNQQASFHAVTWIAWVFACCAVLQLAPNPITSVLITAVSAVVAFSSERRGTSVNAFRLLFVLGLAVIAVRVLLTALTTHGSGSALFHIPRVTLPGFLGGFDVGGAVEGVVVLQAFSDGLAVLALLSVFGAFNSVIAHHELLALIPGPFRNLALVVTVALAFVPSLVASVSAVREADRARTGGSVTRRRGRTLRTVIPIIDGALERAVNLGESIESRGFGRSTVRSAGGAAALHLVAIVAMLAAFVSLVAQNGTATAVAAGVSVSALVGSLFWAASATPHSRYRRLVPAARDACAAAALFALVGIAAFVVAASNTALEWRLEPLQWPSMPVALVALVPLLAFPAVLTTRAQADR